MGGATCAHAQRHLRGTKKKSKKKKGGKKEEEEEGEREARRAEKRGHRRPLPLPCTRSPPACRGHPRASSLSVSPRARRFERGARPRRGRPCGGDRSTAETHGPPSPSHLHPVRQLASAEAPPAYTRLLSASPPPRPSRAALRVSPCRLRMSPSFVSPPPSSPASGCCGEQGRLYSTLCPRRVPVHRLGRESWGRLARCE